MQCAPQANGLDWRLRDRQCPPCRCWTAFRTLESISVPGDVLVWGYARKHRFHGGGQHWEIPPHHSTSGLITRRDSWLISLSPRVPLTHTLRG